jgi:hypothetical protein
VSKYRKSQIEKYFIKEVHQYGKYLTEVLINHHTRELFDKKVSVCVGRVTPALCFMLLMHKTGEPWR